MKTFTLPEIKASQILQRDIPVTGRPFSSIAAHCGLTSSEIISFLQRLSENGILRKFGAILRHQKAGYLKNALVVWAVPADAMENTGIKFAALPFISHCYERKPAFQDHYNLFTMLHAQDDKIVAHIHTMAQLIQCHDFLILESAQEYKKSSPEYF